MASFTRQLDVAQTGDDLILKYTLDASASPLARQPVFTIQELSKPEDEKTASYMRVQPAEMRSRDKPNQFGFDWKLNSETLHVKIHVYSDLAGDQPDDPSLSTFLWEDPEDLTVSGILNKGPTKLRVWPQPVPVTLLDKFMASLCLPDSTPNPGCEAGQAQHDRWIKWLADAFAKPMYADKIEGAIGCMQGGKTTCSHVLGIAFRHFGIPAKYTTGRGDTCVPMPSKSPFVKTVTPDSFPRLGDPYFIGSPTDWTKHSHHAIFGGTGVVRKPPGVGSYSGGWANPKDPMGRTDAGPYSGPSPLRLGDDGASIIIGAPPDAFGLGGNEKKIYWYTDMWAFFAAKSDEIKLVKEGLA